MAHAKLKPESGREGLRMSVGRTMRRLLCWIWLHRWRQYGPFGIRRRCVHCLKRQELHWDGLTYRMWWQ